MADIQEFDFSVDLLKAILWQYNEASNLQAILEAENQWYVTNQKEFWENWIRDVFDLRTANEFGLQVWSIILGLPIYTTIAPSSVTKPTFGFDPYGINFERGNFADITGGSYRLPKESARLLLRLRYFTLISSGTVPETNRMLKYLFGNAGGAYLLDGGDMTQTYVFNFPLSSGLKYLFDNFDCLPRPAGVKSNYIDGTRTFFGFGPYSKNFDNGNFGGEG